LTAILIALNVAAGLFLIGVVLLQSGKGADMGAAFGGASSAVFGPSGAGNVLTKVTAATAAVFMGTSLALAVISAEQPSVIDDLAEPEPPAASVPASPVEEQAAVPSEQPAAGESTPAAQATDPLANAVKKAAQEAVDRAAGGTDTGTPAGDAAKSAAEHVGGEAAKATPGAPAPPRAAAPAAAPVDPVPSRP